MDKQAFIERILETENLTDKLEDRDAKWLLDWGISQLDPLLQDITSEAEANEKVTLLMGILRKINRLVGSRARQRRKTLAGDLMTLAALFSQAFGFASTIIQEDCASAASQLKQTNTRQALELLTGWGSR